MSTHVSPSRSERRNIRLERVKSRKSRIRGISSNSIIVIIPIIPKSVQISIPGAIKSTTVSRDMASDMRNARNILGLSSRK